MLLVPTDYVGRRNTFDAGVGTGRSDLRLERPARLARGGGSIRSHAASHRRLSELSVQEREQEIVRSKVMLEEKLNTPCDVIAFPYGDPGPSEESRVLASAGYTAAFLYGGEPTKPVVDPYRVQRIAMGPDTDLRAELGKLS